MSAQAPYVSVIVPTYQRPSQLATCLAALARQAYPGDRYEAIVVDDGSGVPPAAVMAARSDLAVTLHVKRHAGPAAARNAGAALARGSLLAFTDDDCAPAPTWLACLARRLLATRAALVGGRVVNALAHNPYSTASQLLVGYLNAVAPDYPGQSRFFTSNNLGVWADRFRTVGGFDGNWPLAAAEDREFCDRWQRHGLALTYAPEAVVHHAHPLALRSFLRQHYRYGRGALYFQRARARRGEVAPRLAPPAFYANLLRYPLRAGAGRREWQFAGLLALTQIATAAGFAAEALRRNPGHA